MALFPHTLPPLLRLATAAVALLAVLAAALTLAREPAQAALGEELDPPPPNIVLITTDDQPAGTMLPWVMPHLFERMVGPGTSFGDFVVTTPLCCPSRATLLTGQYGHNNGVLRNDYADLDEKRNILPIWLRRSGYTTAHVGKYLNGYGEFAGRQRDVAPGWDLWFTQYEKKAYYGWSASRNGRVERFGEEDDEHLTEVTSDRAVRWTKRLARAPAPFFLQLDYYAPHGAPGRDARCPQAPVAAPGDEGSFDARTPPQPVSFNEADVSDKPSFIQSRPPIAGEAYEQLLRRYRCTLESLLAVDRGIERVFRKVEAAGELDRTVFVFTSDNGFFFGEHRIEAGKAYPYEENLRMPLVVRVPEQYRRGNQQPATVDAPTANLDLVPTILELADTPPCKSDAKCRVLDGRSLMPLLEGRNSWPMDREILIERNNCDFRGVRTEKQIYIEHGTGPLPQSGRCVPGDIEHYDLAADPFQAENLFPAPRRSPEAALQLELQGRMVALGDCAGIAGRDPEPASGTWCE